VLHLLRMPVVFGWVPLRQAQHDMLIYENQTTVAAGFLCSCTHHLYTGSGHARRDGWKAAELPPCLNQLATTTPGPNADRNLSTLTLI